jgi:probable blue pigment (indigoidine) exporter
MYAVTAALLAIPLLGERLRPMTLGAFALAVLGAALLSGLSPGSTAWSGVLLASLAAADFGLYLVLTRRWAIAYSFDGVMLTLGILITRGPMLLLVEWIRDPGGLLPADPDPVAVVALIVIAFGTSSTANFLVIESARRDPARRTAAMLLLMPLTAAFLSVVLLGERLTLNQILGAALILVGMAGAIGVTAGGRALGMPVHRPDYDS